MTIPPDERLRIMTEACDLISQGSTVKQAAIDSGTTRATLWEWARDDAKLGDLYMRARSTSADAYDDEALEVARASTNESYQRDRLLIDQLKWAAAKRRPKDYSDRQQIDVTGSVSHLHLEALKAARPTIEAKATLALPDTKQDHMQESVGDSVTYITDSANNHGIIPPETA